MFQKLIFAVVVSALTLYAGEARAADSPIAGQWVSNNKGRHVEMDFTNDGQCHLKSTEKGKTTKVDGIYEVTAGRLVVTSNDRKPIVYTMSQQGDSLTLSGGWLAIAQPMTLSKKGTEVAPPTLPMPKENPAPQKPGEPQKPQNPPAADKPEANNTAGLPGGAWDTKALEMAFTVLKTKYDPNTNKVTWLLEKNVDGFLSMIVSFYDEDDVKLGSDYFVFEPGITSVAKGERTRATVSMLKEEDMKKVKKVIITKQ